jgi:hypothetical protein
MVWGRGGPSTKKGGGGTNQVHRRHSLQYLSPVAFCTEVLRECARNADLSLKLVVHMQRTRDAVIGDARLVFIKQRLWRPPLWSSGQSSCLQIRRPGFDSRHYQKKNNGSGTGSTQPREYNREYGRRDPSR